MVVRGGLRACFAIAALRPPIGVLGREQPTGLFSLLRVQVPASSPNKKRAPLLGLYHLWWSEGDLTSRFASLASDSSRSALLRKQFTGLFSLHFHFQQLGCASLFRRSTRSVGLRPLRSAQGSSPCKFSEQEKSPIAGALSFMVVRGGLEPSARGFSVRCSTN